MANTLKLLLYLFKLMVLGIIASSIFIFFAQRDAYSQAPVNVSIQEESPTTKIKVLWSEIELDAKAGDVKTVNEKLNQLTKLQSQAGITDLESYSLTFLTHASEQKALSNWESAAFFIRKALELSPYSPRVALQAWFISSNGLGDSSIAQLFHILPLVFTRADFLMPAIESAIYPVMWALTLGIIASLVILYATNMDEVLRNLATVFPRQLRGFLAPLVLLIGLCTPLWFGPIPCIFAWAALAILFLSKYRNIGLFAGIVIALWGILIPMKENLSLWLEDSGIRTMLRVASGAYGIDDQHYLEALSQARTDDGAAIYTYAQVLRRSGNYNLAAEQISRASHYLSDSRLATAEAAIITFLKGDSTGADQLYQELEDKKFKNAAILFNRSKVKFDLLETEASRELFHEANKLDPEFISRLRPQEELYGIKSPITVADIELHWSDLFSSAKLPMQGVGLLSDRRAASIAPGANPNMLLASGAIIIVLWIISAARQKAHRHISYFSSYKLSYIIFGIIRLIPGGASLLNGRVIRGAVILCAVALLLFPLLRWPAEMRSLSFIMHERAIHYTYIVIFIIAAFSYVGFHSYDGEEEK